MEELNEKEDYYDANQSNTYTAWESFLNKYPSHPEAESIQEKIIELQIAEIIKDEKTGQLPSFEKNGSSLNSENSTVTIENDTGYYLTLRYKGPVTRMVSIVKGSSNEFSLPSGAYTITASANGLNYAGSETLDGSYTTSYYISTSTY